MRVKRRTSSYLIGQKTSLRPRRSVPPEKQKTKLDFSWVPLFSFSFTVFATVVFGAGKAYRQQYLAVFSFTDKVLPWSFQDIVFLGITTQLSILLAAPVVAIGTIMVIVMLTGGLFWLDDRLVVYRLRKATSNKNANRTKSVLDSLLDTGMFLINTFGAIFLFAFLALIFVARANNLGRTDAESAIENIKKPATDKPKLDYVIVERMVRGQKVLEEGYLVSCSDRACGLYSPDRGEEASRLIPLDNILSFRYRTD